MRLFLLPVLVLLLPMQAYAQLSDGTSAPPVSHPLSEAVEAIHGLVESIDAQIVEYDALHARRVELQTWVGKEQGTDISRETSRTHPARARAVSAVRMALEDMRSTHHAEDLDRIQRQLQVASAELQMGIRAELNSISSLTRLLEQLRNEDLPPMH